MHTYNAGDGRFFIHFGEKPGSLAIELERSNYILFSLKFSRGCEDNVITLCLFSFLMFISFGRGTGDVGEDRTIGFSLSDLGFFWYLWADSYGSSSRGRSGIIDGYKIKRWVFGKDVQTESPHKEHTLAWEMLPGEFYTVQAEEYERVCWFRRLPKWKRKFHWIDVTFEPPIPIPANKESDYYSRDDAIWSVIFNNTVNTLDEALDKQRQEVIEWRLKYGGEDWKPRLGTAE